MISVAGRKRRPQSSGKMMEVDDITFDKKVLESDKPVLLYFWAATCKPCKMMKPDIEELENELGEQLDFADTDAVANDGICQRYGVMSTPTLIMFHRGEAVLRLIGYVTRMDMKSKIEEQLKLIA